jgi:glycosyltransferase involved in cell wall biosynthesis
VPTSGVPDSALPTIAVIVPNRNDSRYLPRCIRSILEQDDPPDELIIVDDQSTDDSVAIIRSLISGKPGTRLLENPVNLGTYGALDKGLEVSRSEYVLFLSANDAVLPGLFARARSCLARHPGVGLWSAMGWLVDENDRLIRLHRSPVVSLRDAYIPPEECARMAYRLGNWSVGSTLIYRRPMLEAAGRFDAAYMGLADLVTTWIVASRHGALYSPVPFGASRIHSGSYLSRTLNRENLEPILARLRELGPRLAPELFTPAFLERMALRFRFAAIRAGKGENIALTGAHYPGVRRVLLEAIERLPRDLHRARVALAFLALCPFDIVPALWNRLLGSAAVLALLPFRRHGKRAGSLQ